MENTSEVEKQAGTVQKSILYLASDPSIVGRMKMAGINKTKSIGFFPNNIYPLEASLLMKDTTKVEIERVIDFPEENEYSVHLFIDVLQSQWEKVIVWRSDEIEDEILMMLIAKFAPKNKYPLYEVILDTHKLYSNQDISYLKEQDRNINNIALLLSPCKLESLARQYDVLLKSDTGLRIKNAEGEIVNVDSDYFTSSVLRAVEDNDKTKESSFRNVVGQLMQNNLSYNLAIKVLFIMVGKGMLHIKNKETGVEYSDMSAFGDDIVSFFENAIVVL